jgi:hypothetical protein
MKIENARLKVVDLDNSEAVYFITFEPGPGEAAYMKDRERSLRALSWEQLPTSERNHWERVAEAAIKAAR